MDLHTEYLPLLYVVMALGILAAIVSAGVLADFVVSNRRERLARHQSVVSYYRGLVAAH